MLLFIDEMHELIPIKKELPDYAREFARAAKDTTRLRPWCANLLRRNIFKLPINGDIGLNG